VLGSPVTEVGRDHDYDWAVVEPSSMRSIIQLVGRVRRHRGGAASTANVLICEHNLKRFEQPGEPSFRRPGFESEDHRLERKSLQSLLRAEEYVTPDSRPRLLARETLTPTSSLVDLEHARLMAQMLPQATGTPTARELRIGAPPDPPPLNATAFLSHPQVWLTAILPQQQPFRRSDSRPEAEVVLLPNEDGDDYVLTRINRDGRKVDYATLRDAVDLHRIDDKQVHGERIAPWGISDYLELLEDYATSMALPMSDCAKRYGVVSIPECTYGWRFHPTLGFVTQE
jgi:CRISPR-associated endonuclease/helicase Cas3